MTDLRVVDYETLKTAIANTLNREDLEDHIPVMIQDAEAMFNREIGWRRLEVTDTDTAPGQTVDLPVDFLELLAIQFDGDTTRTPDPMTLPELIRYQVAHPGLQGIPQYYAITGNQLRFDRTPPAGTTLTITSAIRLESLDAVTPTNRLLLEHPDIYKYGALMMAEVFLKNDPRLATWTALYQNARDALRRQSRRAKLGASPPVVRSRRMF